MIESMLEPHLKDSAGANQTEVGLTFLILGGVYMATTPITGYVRIHTGTGCPRKLILALMFLDFCIRIRFWIQIVVALIRKLYFNPN